MVRELATDGLRGSIALARNGLPSFDSDDCDAESSSASMRGLSFEACELLADLAKSISARTCGARWSAHASAARGAAMELWSIRGKVKHADSCGRRRGDEGGGSKSCLLSTPPSFLPSGGVTSYLMHHRPYRRELNGRLLLACLGHHERTRNSRLLLGFSRLASRSPVTILAA